MSLQKELKLTSSQLEPLVAVMREEKNLPDYISTEMLNPAVVTENLIFCGIPEETRIIILRKLDHILKNKQLCLLAKNLSYQLFYTDTDPGKWPKMSHEDDNLGVLYLLAGISMSPLVQKKHNEFGIPRDITEKTCWECASFCMNHQIAYDGKPGILPEQLYWLRNYPQGKLFRIGRFEYMPGKYRHSGPVFRNVNLDSVIALADPRQSLSREGLTFASDAEACWYPEYKETINGYYGMPINPQGMAVNRRVALPKNKWNKVLSPGESVLDLHIPAGGGMHPSLCKESFCAAFEFFNSYFPKLKPKAIACRSWIFNTQLEHSMPKSNIAKLMKEVYLLPAPPNDRAGLFFVFCREYEKLSDYPRNTRLQKVLLDILESGAKLRTGGMFIFNQDIQYYGTQKYRADWEKTCSDIFT